MTQESQAPSAGNSVREPPQTTLEIEMDSALTPREIQARIRAGESVEEVARAAGMGLDWIEPFAAPVLAERVFISSQAQSHPVRRGSDTIAHRTLAEVVADRLASRKVDVDTLIWQRVPVTLAVTRISAPSMLPPGYVSLQPVAALTSRST